MRAMHPIISAAAALGGQTQLARVLGVTPPAVNQWISGFRPIPVLQCPAIERATGVSVEELRPDVCWHRVPDPDWPNPAGRPLIDVVAEARSALARTC